MTKEQLAELIGQGGNDESVYLSDFNFVTIDDYRTFPEVMREFLD